MARVRGVMSAAGVVAMLPILVFAMSVQRYLVRGLSLGAALVWVPAAVFLGKVQGTELATGLLGVAGIVLVLVLAVGVLAERGQARHLEGKLPDA